MLDYILTTLQHAYETGLRFFGRSPKVAPEPYTQIIDSENQVQTHALANEQITKQKEELAGAHSSVEVGDFCQGNLDTSSPEAPGPSGENTETHIRDHLTAPKPRNPN